MTSDSYFEASFMSVAQPVQYELKLTVLVKIAVVIVMLVLGNTN